MDTSLESGTNKSSNHKGGTYTVPESKKSHLLAFENWEKKKTRFNTEAHIRKKNQGSIAGAEGRREHVKSKFPLSPRKAIRVLI